MLNSNLGLLCIMLVFNADIIIRFSYKLHWLNRHIIYEECLSFAAPQCNSFFLSQTLLLPQLCSHISESSKRLTSSDT